ncbi:MAG: hypothetical protein ACQKBV_10575 [Puniceicoccales bacterium]
MTLTAGVLAPTVNAIVEIPRYPIDEEVPPIDLDTPVIAPEPDPVAPDEVPELETTPEWTFSDIDGNGYVSEFGSPLTFAYGQGLYVDLDFELEVADWNSFVRFETVTLEERAVTFDFIQSNNLGNLRGPAIFDLSGTMNDPVLIEMDYELANGESPTDYRLGWLNPQGNWVNAVDGNVANGVGAGFYEMSFASYLATTGVAAVSDSVGAYGYDAETNQVWAVVDHNSQFAPIVVPEPSTYAVWAGFVALGYCAMRRRK